MNAKYVQLIAVVSEAGSLGAAAAHLNKSQPAVSKALQLAEAEIGCRIFQRSPAGVVPTVEGERVVARCRRICRDLDLLSEDIAQVRGDIGGTLNLAVSPLAAVRIVPRVLKRFFRRYPGVQVQVIGGHSSRAFKLLRNRQVDYVIGPGPEPGKGAGLRSKELMRSPITFVTGQSSRYLAERDPKVLQQAPWLMIGPRGKRPLFQSFFEAYGLEVPQPVVSSDSILTIMSMVEGSDHICSFPAQLYPDMASKWKISQLALPSKDLGVTLTLTADMEQVPTMAALAFEDMVESVVGQIQRDGHNPEL